jgi:hypothetical protein
MMRKVEADRELRRQCFKAANASETDALLIEDCRASGPRPRGTPFVVNPF